MTEKGAEGTNAAFAATERVCGLKFEARNPKSETNPKSEPAMSKTTPRVAVLKFFRFLFFEFVSGFGFRISDLDLPLPLSIAEE
jgi:hypothetical protein